MPKVQSLKVKADYKGPTTKGKYQATHLQIDWQGPVLHYKDGLFWKKLAFKDVDTWKVHAEPGGKPDKYGMLKILHIIKLHTKKAMWEFAIPPDVFETWLYWIIRSLVKHTEISLSKEEIKQSPLLAKHKDKTTFLHNISVFERAHRHFMDALNILQLPPDKQKKSLIDFGKGEGGTSFGRIEKKLGSGGSGTEIYKIIKMLEPVEIGGEWSEDGPVAVKVSETDIKDENAKESMSGLIKEARVLALLGKHPNIVGLVDAALSNNRFCLYMELGKCDLTKISNENPTEQLIIKYAQGILAGITHMHKCRVFHLDMKPANVIISNDDVAKIIDFGLARGATMQSKSERFEVPGNWASMGTNGYISPEAWDWGGEDRKKETGDNDLAKRDSYAVGMTIINGLLGPFMGMNEVVVNFGEGQPQVLNRIQTWRDRFTAKEAEFRINGLGDLAKAAIGLIAEAPQQRWTVEEALEFLSKTDRRRLRQDRMSSNRNDVLKTMNEQNKKLGQLKKWGV